MPNKTRKDKMRADTNRYKMASSPLTYTAPFLQSTTSLKSANEDHDLTFIRRDLLKTVILASLFIGSEIVLSIYSRQLGW